MMGRLFFLLSETARTSTREKGTLGWQAPLISRTSWRTKSAIRGETIKDHRSVHVNTHWDTLSQKFAAWAWLLGKLMGRPPVRKRPSFSRVALVRASASRSRNSAVSNCDPQSAYAHGCYDEASARLMRREPTQEEARPLNWPRIATGRA